MSATAAHNLATCLRRNAESFPDRRALSALGRDGNWQHRSYRELEQETDAYAHGLQTTGIGQGTKVALVVRADLEMFSIVFALFKLGAVPVVVDPGMGLDRILHCYRAVGVEALVGIPLAHVVRLLRPGSFKTLRSIVTVGRRYGWGGASMATLADRGRRAGPFMLAPTSGTDPLMINFTTGSTGPAKPAVTTHSGGAAMMRRVSELIRLNDGDVTLVTLPFMAVLDVLLGSTAVLAPMDPTRPAFADAGKILATIGEFNVSHMFASPALLHRLVGHRAALPPLRTVISGGAPVNASIVLGFRALLSPETRFETTYGATEALTISSIDSTEILGETAALTGTGRGTCVGRPTDELEIRVVGISDEPIASWNHAPAVASGEVGELVIRGAVVSPRYHDDPTSNARYKIDGDWHRTGDLGWIDDRGRVWFCGRRSHRVVTADGPLFSVQVEGIFNAHPDVYRTALVGIGATASKKPVICVELRPGTHDRDRIETELRRLAAEHSLTAAIDTFLFHPSFPVDIRHNAKIKREELAAWATWVLHPPPRTLKTTALQAIPIAGWIFVVIGLVWPLPPVLRVLWAIDVFLSVVVHGLQLVAALPIGKRAGYSTPRTVFNTFLLGATWWKPLAKRLTP